MEPAPVQVFLAAQDANSVIGVIGGAPITQGFRVHALDMDGGGRPNTVRGSVLGRWREASDLCVAGVPSSGAAR